MLFTLNFYNVLLYFWKLFCQVKLLPFLFRHEYLLLYMKDYTQLLKHSQFSIVTETAEGAQERHFHIGPINISTLHPFLSPPKNTTF